jgi:hypothetical protein
MSNGERRRHSRKDAQNLLDYTILGDNGEPVDRGIGRTINISEKGILFETHIPLRVDQVLLITLELEENLVEIKGCVRHVSACLENFNSGVVFLQVDGDGEQVLKKYLETCGTAQP